MRHDGTSWIASDALLNDGEHISIGTTNPTFSFECAEPASIDQIIISSTQNSGNLSLAAEAEGLPQLASGEANVSIGGQNLQTLVNGNDNIVVGFQSANNIQTGSANIAIGNGSLTGAVDVNNLVIGNNAGTRITGSNSFAIGHGALGGSNAPASSGLNNMAIGNNALSNLTTGSFNTMIGSSAGTLQNGVSNTALGYNAQSLSNSTQNTSVGAFSLYQSTGNNNAAFGYEAMLDNTTGNNNAAFGMQAMRENVSGIRNMAGGMYSSFLNTSGSFNTTLGFASGDFRTSFSNCVYLGCDSYGDIENLTNSTCLGFVSRGTANNQVRLGNTFVTSIGGFVNYTNLSDGRFKKNVQEDVKGLDFIMKLRPVTYTLAVNDLAKELDEDQTRDENGNKIVRNDASIQEARNAKEQIRYTGFIAQEVEQAAIAVGYDFSGVDKPKNDTDFYGLRYAEFTVPLVKSVQEIAAEMETLKKENEALREQLNEILLQLNKSK
jgi:hypothetical protein